MPGWQLGLAWGDVTAVVSPLDGHVPASTPPRTLDVMTLASSSILGVIDMQYDGQFLWIIGSRLDLSIYPYVPSDGWLARVEPVYGTMTIFNLAGFSPTCLTLDDPLNVWLGAQNPREWDGNLMPALGKFDKATHGFEVFDPGPQNYGPMQGITFDGTNVWTRQARGAGFFSFERWVVKWNVDGTIDSEWEDSGFGDSATGNIASVGGPIIDGGQIWFAPDNSLGLTRFDFAITRFATDGFVTRLVSDGTYLWVAENGVITRVSPNGSMVNYTPPAPIYGLGAGWAPVVLYGSDLWFWSSARDATAGQYDYTVLIRFNTVSHAFTVYQPGGLLLGWKRFFAIIDWFDADAGAWSSEVVILQQAPDDTLTWRLTFLPLPDIPLASLPLGDGGFKPINDMFGDAVLLPPRQYAGQWPMNRATAEVGEDDTSPSIWFKLVATASGVGHLSRDPYYCIPSNLNFSMDVYDSTGAQIAHTDDAGSGNHDPVDGWTYVPMPAAGDYFLRIANATAVGSVVVNYYDPLTPALQAVGIASSLTGPSGGQDNLTSNQYPGGGAAPMPIHLSSSNPAVLTFSSYPSGSENAPTLDVVLAAGQWLIPYMYQVAAVATTTVVTVTATSATNSVSANITVHPP
jgi:hypothetical protein